MTPNKDWLLARAGDPWEERAPGVPQGEFIDVVPLVDVVSEEHPQ